MLVTQMGDMMEGVCDGTQILRFPSASGGNGQKKKKGSPKTPPSFDQTLKQLEVGHFRRSIVFVCMKTICPSGVVAVSR
jgi:hypothetical protein